MTGSSAKLAVQEYLVDLNQSAAYLRARYKLGKTPSATSSLASNLFAKPSMQTAVQAAFAARAERTGITADRVVQEFAKVGLASMRRFITIDSDGQGSEPFVSSSDADNDDG